MASYVPAPVTQLLLNEMSFYEAKLKKPENVERKIRRNLGIS